MTFAAVLRGLALGLPAGVGCLGLCLPVAAPMLFGRERAGFRQTAGTLGLFLAGRLAAYLTAGLTSGLLGIRFGAAGTLRIVIIPLAYCLLGVAMVLFGGAQAFASPGLCRLLRPAATSGWLVIATGFLAGISPCPPFLLAVAAAVEAGGIVNALLFFAAFYLATTLYLLPLLVSGWAARFGPVRVAARIIAMAAGLYFATIGAIRLSQTLK